MILLFDDLYEFNSWINWLDWIFADHVNNEKF